MVNYENANFINYTQVHIAATMSVKNQLVTCDLEKVKNLLPGRQKNASFYDLYGIKGFGNFINKFKAIRIQNFDDVSYLQVIYTKSISLFLPFHKINKNYFLQEYSENIHLLRKGVKDKKFSFFVNKILGDLFEKSTIFFNEKDGKEFHKHRRNVKIRRQQFSKYLGSLYDGATCRFECAFDSLYIPDIFSKPELSKNNKKRNLMDRFKDFFNIFLLNDCFVISKGDWWFTQVLDPFKELTLIPYFNTLSSSSNVAEGEKTYMGMICGMNDLLSLSYVYDLENIVYRWCYGSHNDFIDHKRLTVLIELSRNFTSSEEKSSPAISPSLNIISPAIHYQDTCISNEYFSNFFHNKTTKRFGYPFFVNNCVQFLLHQAPKTQKEALSMNQNDPIKIFSLMLR